MKNKIIFTLVPSFILCMLFSGLVVAQKEQTHTVEGSVVAFQKVNRCPSCKGSDGGVGIQAENWILRVDVWDSKRLDSKKYILVKYKMYDRSLSSSEINKKLTFVLRERREHEKETTCLDEISYAAGGQYFSRPVEFKDYVFTDLGRLETVPSEFKNLPCFIIENLPVSLH